MKLIAVTPEMLYETIDSYITDNNCKVKTYEGMIDVVLKMMKGGYCFSFDRDILRDAMESLTYMYCPGDEMNKDRVVCQLEDMDDDIDESDSDDGDLDPMSALAGLGGLGGPGGDPMQMMSKLFSGMVDPNSVKKEECDDCPKKECDDVTVEDIEDVTDEISPEEKKEE
jgi:hypothetical protein